MAGSVMVSYAKARAESLVPTAEVGFWERSERLTLMILGALTNRMDWALWILAIGPNITVIHRILDTWKQTEHGHQPIPDATRAVATLRDAKAPSVNVRAGAPASLQAKISNDARGASPAVLTRTARRGG
jgi:hypothetical protein